MKRILVVLLVFSFSLVSEANALSKADAAKAVKGHYKDSFGGVNYEAYVSVGPKNDLFVTAWGVDGEGKLVFEQTCFLDIWDSIDQEFNSETQFCEVEVAEQKVDFMLLDVEIFREQSAKQPSIGMHVPFFRF